VEIVPINEHEPFFIGDIYVVPVLVYHYKLPVLGFRIRNFTYITDASAIPEAEMEKIKGSSVIVLNALRKEPHISHFNLEQAIGIMQQLGPEQGYFTHISHLLGRHAEVEKQLPENIRLAYDGLKITV
jgi:phosphoribosyl 1,2-cyclic phosphate phosphodiesterase